MAYNNTRNSTLYHSGIPGMRWYQRRFQNEDGSLTPAGRERYRKAEAKREKIAAKAEAKEHRKRNKLKNSITKNSIGRKQLGAMSDDELNSRITRLEKEKKYLELSGNVTEKSKDTVKKILGDAGQKAASKIAEDVLVYTGKRIVKQFVDDDTYKEIFPKKN